MRTHLGRPLERMGHCDNCTGKQYCLTFGECSICVAFHIASMLFVICLLSRCESATDWNTSSNRAGFALFRDMFGSIMFGNQSYKMFEMCCTYIPCGSLFWRIHLLPALGRKRKLHVVNIRGTIRKKKHYIFMDLDQCNFTFCCIQLGLARFFFELYCLSCPLLPIFHVVLFSPSPFFCFHLPSCPTVRQNLLYKVHLSIDKWLYVLPWHTAK